MPRAPRAVSAMVLTDLCHVPSPRQQPGHSSYPWGLALIDPEWGQDKRNDTGERVRPHHLDLGRRLLRASFPLPLELSHLSLQGGHLSLQLGWGAESANADPVHPNSFFFFVAAPYGMWDLSSLTRD